MTMPPPKNLREAIARLAPELPSPDAAAIEAREIAKDAITARDIVDYWDEVYGKRYDEWQQAQEDESECPTAPQ